MHSLIHTARPFLFVVAEKESGYPTIDFVLKYSVYSDRANEIATL